jgi:hypothetical protein
MHRQRICAPAQLAVCQLSVPLDDGSGLRRPIYLRLDNLVNAAIGWKWQVGAPAARRRHV